MTDLTKDEMILQLQQQVVELDKMIMKLMRQMSTPIWLIPGPDRLKPSEGYPGDVIRYSVYPPTDADMEMDRGL